MFPTAALMAALAPALIVGAAVSQAPETQDRRALDMPSYQAPSSPWKDIEDARCGRAIERAREEAGQPKLDRQPASPERPLHVKAVDQRIEGCSVLVMAQDTADIRPLPEPPAAEPRLAPAN